MSALAPLTVVSGSGGDAPARVEISPTARLRFDELRSNAGRIATTMLAASATRAAVEQADAALAEIAAQAHAARLALRRGR